MAKKKPRAKVASKPTTRPTPKKASSKASNKASRPTSKKSPRKAGRPIGPSVQRDEVTVIVSRCKRCGSTRRARYSANRQIIRNVRGGVEPGTNNPVTHLIVRPTRCLDCGQARRDVSYLNEPELSLDQVIQSQQDAA